MSREEEAPEKKKRKRKRRWPKWLLVLLFLFAGLLVWLNGPGWRWLGKIGIEKALAKSNMKADFTLAGTLIGGARVEKLSLSGGAIRKLEIDAVEPLYKISRVVKGDWNAVLEGVKVSKINAVIDLDAAPPKDPNEPEKPFDPDILAEALRKARKFLLPLDLGAADLNLQLVRGEESLITLESSDFGHEPGSDEFRLKLGTIAAGPGYALAAQDSVIQWKKETLDLNHFEFSPRVGVSDLHIGMPLSGGISAAGVVRIEDSRLVLEGTTTYGKLRLEGQPLPLHEAAKNFAFGLPVQATLRSLEAEFRDFHKAPTEWQATAKAELSDIRYEDWQINTFSYQATKAGSTGKVAWSLAALDSNLTGEADLRWRDLAKGTWTDFEASTKLKIPQLSPLFAALNKKFAFVPPEAAPLPASALTLDAKADMGPEAIRSASATWLLSPEKDAPSLAGETKWTPDGKLGGTLGTDGLRATYALDLTAKTYEAGATFEGFRPERLSPWSMAAAVELPTGMNATGTWQGSGVFGAEPHRGTFDIPSFEWVRKDATPPLILRTKGDYNWPREVNLASLTAVAEGQTINAQASLANRVLIIPKIEWKDGETRLVGGQAEIPVPEKPGDVKAFLKQTEPINVFLESEWIDNARLAAWLPEKKSPLSEGSGRIHLVITGTPAAPKLDFETQLKGLRVPDQPDVPVTDATLSLDGADGSLALKGEIRPAGYPPVTLSGKMPFKPGEWAENPGMVLEEKFEARANIPRLQLATFQKMLPNATQLAGSVEGFIGGGGTLGKPDLSGEVRLSGGALTLKDSEVPPITGGNALVRLQGKDVLLESLSVELASGAVKGSGKVGLADAAKPTFDISLKGTSLPLKRDESMIVRADADLAIRGDLQMSTISGTVDIVDSLFYKDFEILPVRVPFTAPSRPTLPTIDPEEKAADFPEPFRNWALNVQVRTRDPLLIRGNLARGVVVANVRFGGTLGTIQPQGNATIGEVTARLPFSTLKVDNGAVVFTPAGGLNPELNIRGTSTIGRYEVNVYFYGPVNAPKTALTSDPPLAESEIMTLLATGTTSDGLEGGQAATLKAAQLLVEEWRKGRLPFAAQVAKVMEVVNRVDVRIGEDDPLTGKRLNSATIELHDRWFVSGSVDKQSNTRVLGAFVIRFK
ncbi:translocation/assembly module TamB domain-containing protein [Luteolibacter sp. Populi]|uniref:translocation/assembly module TamB domain-containing protein n=1 Tax=Luteolibacter sp. Populi TaxID=3230487 RepID=UPI0034654337